MNACGLRCSYHPLQCGICNSVVCVSLVTRLMTTSTSTWNRIRAFSSVSHSKVNVLALKFTTGGGGLILVEYFEPYQRFVTDCATFERVWFPSHPTWREGSGKIANLQDTVLEESLVTSNRNLLLVFGILPL
jgi:hypothetical protein